MDDRLNDMTTDELREKLKKLKDSLCDLEDMHLFTFGKTSLHIGGKTAQNMQTAGVGIVAEGSFRDTAS